LPLAHQFANILRNRLNAIVPAGKWNCGHRIGSGREAVDVCGRLAGRLVFIEVELRRDEPLTNVTKLWRAIEENKQTNKIILVHTFSGHYPANNSHRINAEFIGRHMEQLCGATYIPIYFAFRPKKGATVLGDYRRRAAMSLASSIFNSLKQFVS
jgi:hypothetical protein